MEPSGEWRTRRKTPRRWRLAGHDVDVLAAIGLGGLLGAELRQGLEVALPRLPNAWPTATLSINTTGCFLIGVLMVSITELFRPHRLLRALLGVGVLGGYTTFSTYTVEAAELLSAGHAGSALGYLVLTPVLALLAVWSGSTLTRRVATTIRPG
jgi:fluoride exporter